MILAIDIGNTNIGVGIFQEKKLIKNWNIRTELEKTCDEYGIIILNLLSLSGMKPEDIKSVVLSSVVPPLTPDTCLSIFKPESIWD